MAVHDAANAGEIPMDIPQRAEHPGYLVVVAGTSRSFLSQMKSLLL